MFTPEVHPVKDTKPIVRTIPGTDQWEVLCMWHGAMRRVFTGSLHECAWFVNHGERA